MAKRTRLKKKEKKKEEKQLTVKRNYKDSIFRDLFNNEQALRELYGALAGCDISEDEPIEIVTLKDVIHNSMKNDLSFLYGLKIIVMIEHQSTDCPNLPVRMFCYLAEEYEKMLDERVYGTTQITLPKPELYVFYNGNEDREEEWEQRLSDAFAVIQDNPAVEVVVKVININYEKGAQLLERSKTLKGYSILLHKVNEYILECGDREEAMQRAIKECIEEGYIADYLEREGGKVMSILRMNMTEEQKKNMWASIFREEGREEGRKEGREEGRTEIKRVMAFEMKNDGIPIEKIMQYTKLPREMIESL